MHHHRRKKTSPVTAPDSGSHPPCTAIGYRAPLDVAQCQIGHHGPGYPQSACISGTPDAHQDTQGGRKPRAVQRDQHPP